jgi:hypothetical protein
VNRSQSLDHRAGLFPGWLDQGGPSAADRLTSSIGTCCRSRCVVAPRCSLYAKPRILAARRRGSFRPRTGVAKAENRNSASKWRHKARQCRDRVTPIFTPRVFAMTLRASWAYLFAQAVRKAAAAARDPIVDGSAIERSLAFSSFEPSRGAVRLGKGAAPREASTHGALVSGAGAGPVNCEP